MQEIERLKQIMRELRDPDTGCPWDIKQDFASVAPYTIEEAYEVADAIERHDIEELKKELGDLLFQVIFHSQMAEEQGLFDFEDVVKGINEKMIRRHPHVFADEEVVSEEHLAQRWEQHKKQERSLGDETEGALHGIAATLPALLRSQKLQKRAAQTGFDWPDIYPVFDKLDEEVAELKDELEHEDNHERILDEFGDVLFVCVNLAKHLKVDAEQALRHANKKFIDRFVLMEKLLREDGKELADCALDEMEEYWQRSKRQLKK